MIVRRKEHVVARRIDDEAVLVPIRNNTAAPLTVHALGSVATFIWEALDGRLDDAGLAVLVSREFEVDVAQATIDVGVFLRELSAANLVEVAA